LLWEDQPVEDDEARHRSGLQYVGHNDALKPNLTVSENLAFWCRQRRPAAEVAQAVKQALEKVNLLKLSTYPSRLLSAGQKRRLTLARLFVAPAPLWILDEPANGLDKMSVQMLLEALQDHRQQGGMVALAAHGELAAADALPNARQLDMGPWSQKAAELAQKTGDLVFSSARI